MAKPDNAPAGAPSRRGLLQGATTLALPFPSTAAGADHARTLGERWRLLEAEKQRLALTWQAVESRLFKDQDWRRLRPAEQERVAEAVQMRAIDAQIARLHKAQEQLLPQLRRTPAETRAGLTAKFDVLDSLLEVADHPAALALFRGCRRDLKRLWA